jgi:hypothetical protein
VTLVADIPLRGAGGEPVDFARTIASHGVAELPPNRLDLQARVLETTLPIPRGARTIRPTGGDKLGIDAVAGNIGERARDADDGRTCSVSTRTCSTSLVKEDGELSWCAVGMVHGDADRFRRRGEDGVNVHTNGANRTFRSGNA